MVGRAERAGRRSQPLGDERRGRRPAGVVPRSRADLHRLGGVGLHDRFRRGARARWSTGRQTRPALRLHDGPGGVRLGLRDRRDGTRVVGPHRRSRGAGHRRRVHHTGVDGVAARRHPRSAARRGDIVLQRRVVHRCGERSIAGCARGRCEQLASRVLPRPSGAAGGVRARPAQPAGERAGARRGASRPRGRAAHHDRHDELDARHRAGTRVGLVRPRRARRVRAGRRARSRSSCGGAIAIPRR